MGDTYLLENIIITVIAEKEIKIKSITDSENPETTEKEYKVPEWTHKNPQINISGAKYKATDLNNKEVNNEVDWKVLDISENESEIFELVDSNGYKQLRFKDNKGPNFENPLGIKVDGVHTNKYEILIRILGKNKDPDTGTQGIDNNKDIRETVTTKKLQL